MKLIVGLGNPGKEYQNTRHNLGFWILDQYLQKEKNTSVDWREKFQGLYFKTKIAEEEVIFLKPQSYMNLSGGVVADFVRFYKINLEDILVISDDLDLKVGNFKLKDKGSSGGHNGLKDIEKNLGTDKYKRLKIGISNNKLIGTKDYVLGKISSEDIKIYQDLFSVIKKVIDDFFRMDFQVLMNKYNRKNR